MADNEDGIRDRLKSQGEEKLGKLAQDLLENPLVNKAITGAFDAREKASHAQEVAMGALNLPSAADFERVARRVRTVSQRVEAVEDALDRIEERLAVLATEFHSAVKPSAQKPTAKPRKASAKRTKTS